MSCIVCHRDDSAESIEHIISKALGNEFYVLPRGTICRNCNNKIARLESAVLTHPEWLSLRMSKSSDKGFIHEHYQKILALFIAKMGFEGLYRSHHKLWSSYDWSWLTALLLKPDFSIDFVPLRLKTIHKAEWKSIPRYWQRWLLHRHRLALLFKADKNDLYFLFIYDRIAYSVKISGIMIHN